jgi:L-2-hydroxyglutarate oxidase LhgO
VTEASGSGGIGVVGGGILGLAVARRLSLDLPGTAVTVLEKEDAVATHQTGRNSGVVHAGLYYQPGSLKARLCRRGVGLLREYCQEKGVRYDECGKLVVASTPDELPRLEAILQRATANGVPDLRRVDAVGLAEIEPHAVGVAAVHSPHTAITDYPAVARALADDVATAGGEVLLGFRVTAISSHGPGGGVVVTAADGRRRAFHRLVVCAGLQGDLVARLAGDERGPAIVPFRGEYYRLVAERIHLVRGLIYPVPDPAYPFLGVHFTRRVDGGVDVGPNAVLAAGRQAYRRVAVDPVDLTRTLSWPGFRRLAVTHWRTGLGELAGSVSRRVFMARARVYVPEVRDEDVVPAPPGIRAQAVDRDGSLVDDFRINDLGPIVAIRNAPSPGATSSLAIAEHIAGVVTGARAA